MLDRDSRIMIQNRKVSLQRELQELNMDGKETQFYIDVLMRISHSARNLAVELERPLLQTRIPMEVTNAASKD